MWNSSPSPKYGTQIGRPLVGFGQQHLAGELLVEFGAQFLQDAWVSGRFSHEVPSRSTRYGTASRRKPSTPMLQPELHHLPHFFAHSRIVVVQIGLMAEEAMPVIVLRNRVPCPVRQFGIDEDDADAADIACRCRSRHTSRAWVVSRLARFLKPGMLIGGVVQHHFDDHANAALMGSLEKGFEIVERAVAGMDGGVVGDVVAVVAQRRREKRHEPDGIDPQLLQIVELLREAPEIANAIAHWCHRTCGRGPGR